MMLRTVVHEEVGRLPERNRAAVVLCLLEGMTPEQAARHLGWPVGTVHSRLARGRERLRGRLTRRGLMVPAGLLGTASMCPKAGVAAVPAALAETTARLALKIARGQVPAGTVPAAVASLTATISRSMLMTSMRMPMGMLLMLGLVAAGAGVLARQEPGTIAVSRERSAGRLPLDASAARASQTAAPDLSNDPVPPGARFRLGTSRFRPPSIVADMALSPDGTTIVTVGDELIAWDAATGRERWRAPTREDEFRSHGPAYGMRAVAFGADGSRFYTPGRLGEVVTWETATGRREVLKVAWPRNLLRQPDQSTPSVDVSPDGKWLAVGNGDGLVVCDRFGKLRFEIANKPPGPLKVDNRGPAELLRRLLHGPLLAGRNDAGRGHQRPARGDPVAGCRDRPRFPDDRAGRAAGPIGLLPGRRATRHHRARQRGAALRRRDRQPGLVARRQTHRHLRELHVRRGLQSRWQASSRCAPRTTASTSWTLRPVRRSAG